MRLKRYNRFNLQTNCRICLTQSVASKVSLNSPLRDEQSKPLVYEALELLTNEKVPLKGKYPDSVCGMCIQLLKISYDLICQYQESKQRLREELRELGEDSETDSDANDIKPRVEPSKAPVDIFIGEEKFNIQDLLIVEEETDESGLYDGFLKNLGKTVTASFVKKGSQKLKCPVEEEPAIVIEKLVQEPISETPAHQLIEISTPTDELIPQKSILPKISDLIYTIEVPKDVDEEAFLNEPANTEAFENIDQLDEKERDVLQSALNLRYKCPYCSKPMASLTRAKIHARRCEKNSTSMVCWICDSSFNSRKQLLKHIKAIHVMDDRNVKDIEKLMCKICNKMFTSKGSLFYHMSKHSGKLHTCDVCEKQFYTKTQLDSHIQIHNREKTVVVCPICGKGFHYKSGLFYHMKMHLNDRNIQCTYCPRKFYTTNSRKRHELTHTGARPYSCQFCDKKFRSMGETRKHELIHTGERPFHCKYCKTGYTQAHNLKMHLMTHAGQFQCTHCYKGFAEADILKFHLRNKHHIVQEDIEETIECEANEEQFQVESQKEQVGIEDNEILEASDIGLDRQAYYITEQYAEEEDNPSEAASIFMRTYELRDEVLVETIEHLN